MWYLKSSTGLKHAREFLTLLWVQKETKSSCEEVKNLLTPATNDKLNTHTYKGELCIFTEPMEAHDLFTIPTLRSFISAHTHLN